jgi:hypothetical protein
MSDRGWLTFIRLPPRRPFQPAGPPPRLHDCACTIHVSQRTGMGEPARSRTLLSPRSIYFFRILPGTRRRRRNESGRKTVPNV